MLSLLVLLISIPEIATQVRCNWSTLEYSHSKEFQAVGSPATFTVNATASVSSEGPAPVCRWILNLKNGTPVDLIKWLYNPSAAEWYCLDSSVCSSNEQYNVTNASVHGNRTFVEMTITFGHLELRLNNTSLLASDDDCENKPDNLPIQVFYCGKYADDLYVNHTSPAIFGTDGKCECSKGQLYSSTGAERNGSATCDQVAEWTGCKEDECWFEPIVNLTLRVNGSFSDDWVVFSGSHIELLCNKSEDGYPKNATIHYLKNTYKVNNSFTATPGDHHAEFKCQARNSLVIVKKNETGFSNAIFLNVLYPPKESETFKRNQSANINDTGFELEFNFTANPMPSYHSVTLHFEGRVLNENNSLQNNSVYQTFIHKFAVVKEADFGEYILETNTDLGYKNFSVNFTPYSAITSTLLSTTLDPKASVTEGTIIGICVLASVVLIALLLTFLWKIRQRQTKQGYSEREERANEIYGSMPENATKGGRNVKEEKSNVLYVTTDSSVGMEEAYAVVNRKKNKGSENSAFTHELATTDVTYAAVDKPGKSKKVESSLEAVYSAVNKNREEKKGGNTESGLHGLPSCDKDDGMST